METIYNAQSLAFPSYDQYQNNLTQSQTAQSYGIGLDENFQKQIQSNEKLKVATGFSKYFNAADAQYIKPAKRNYDALEISSNALGTFQKFNSPLTALQNAHTVFEMKAAMGMKEGRQTIALARAALQIATRASERQLQEHGVMSRQPGALAVAFPPQTYNRFAGNFVEKLARFMEPDELRETLWNVGISSKNGAFRSNEMAAFQQDSMHPGNNLASEAASITDGAVRNGVIRDNVARGIRFQRMMPPYQHMGANGELPIQRVARQHRAANGFKPAVSDRFGFK